MIYLECEPDKVLVKALGISRKEIKHAFSKGNVCNKLEKSRNSKGLVDEDPLRPQPTYIGKLKLHSHEKDIKLLSDENAQNYLIMLCPTLEEWILKAVKELGVNIVNFGLPDDAGKLHKIINIKLGSFENLIEDIKKRKSGMLKTLEGFIIKSK
jgi:hypothetical protein